MFLYTRTVCHSYSQVICCGSSDDGVERPLGEAFARSVVDEGYHDNGAIHPGRGQLHQLTGRQMKVESVCVQYCRLCKKTVLLGCLSLILILLRLKCFG